MLVNFGFRIMSGGADSGFRKVKPEEYKPRLLHVSRKRKIVSVNEVNLNNLFVPTRMQVFH